MEKAAQIKKYWDQLPQRIHAEIENTDEGLWAKLTSDDGRLVNCYTQASDTTELVHMVNDAVLTYFEVPEKMRAAVGFYLPLSKNHLNIEEMFNRLIAIQKQTHQQARVETTLTLNHPGLCECH